jgi:hypothetical protein
MYPQSPRPSQMARESHRVWGVCKVMAIKPIFLFSISRSGSTLVQRIIAAHKGVATVSEPWLLLPYAYASRRRGIDAEYPHAVMVDAIEDFCQELPGGDDEYRREVHDHVMRLYNKVAGHEARYFLDKSPYYHVSEEVIRLFPEGKFVFLWRNPLGIAASSMSTWQDKWRPTMFRQELFVGLPRLVASYEANRTRAHSMRFEDLISGEEKHWRELMEYLEIPFETAALEEFSQVKLNGRMGDPTGTKRYSALSTEPIDKWKREFSNPLRKEWCRRYLRYLGDHRLAAIGYDGRQLLEELESQPTSTEDLLPDIGRMIKDVWKEPIRVHTRTNWIGGPNVIRELLRS